MSVATSTEAIEGGEAEGVRSDLEALLAQYDSSDETAFLGALFDAGLAWVHFRPGDGGRGLTPKLQELVDSRLEEVGRRPVWTRNPMGIGMVGPTIAAHGTDEQRQAYLRRIWTAEDIWCQLFSEPGAGSDVATLATRAVRDGDEWTVNGQKVWTSLGHRARYGLLIARTDPDVPKHVGITAFLIDMKTPGVEVRPLRQMTGNAEFCEVYFTDAHIPDSARIGEVGAGWRVAVTTLMNERVSIGGAIAPRGSGPIASAMAAWRQGGHSDPARRDELMKLWSESEILRLGNVRAQQLRQRGVPGPEGSVLKLGQALLDQRIRNFAVTLGGASGMLHPGYDDHATGPTNELLQVQASTIAGGTTEVMRNILGERLLGLPPEPRVDKDVAWSAIPKGV